MPEGQAVLRGHSLWTMRHLLFGSFVGAYRARRGMGLPKTAAQWEVEYADGDWAYLEGMAERSHHMVILGYLLAGFDRPSVLDAGCGAGTLLQLLGGFRIGSYDGMDTSRVAIEQARVRMRGTELPFPADFQVAGFEQFATDKRYDVIVFNESLSYVRDPLAVLKSFERFLLPGGKFIISLCYNWWQAPILDRIIRAYSVLHSADVINEQGLSWRVRVLGRDAGFTDLPAANVPVPRRWQTAVAERSVIVRENAAAIAGLLPGLFVSRRNERKPRSRADEDREE